MSLKFSKVFLLLIFVVVGQMGAFAKEYKASLANLPVYAESKDKGVLVDLVKAIAEVSGEKFNIKVLPFASSVYMATKNKVDFHMPLIKNEIIEEDKLPFYYSTETIFRVNFVIYSKKDSDVNINNISEKIVETDRAHSEYFPFKTIPSNSIAKSLEKVNSGKIDAFIFADFATDPLVKKENYKDMKRELFKVFESKMILPKNDAGKNTDKVLTAAIGKLRASGKFEEIMHDIDASYVDWQP